MKFIKITPIHHPDPVIFNANCIHWVKLDHMGAKRVLRITVVVNHVTEFVYAETEVWNKAVREAGVPGLQFI